MTAPVILPAQITTTLDPAEVTRITKAARDFEAMALGQLLAPMFQTVDGSHGPFGGGDGEAAWRPMLTQELARHMADHGGVGLARPVLLQMLGQVLRQQEHQSDPAPPASPEPTEIP